MYAGKQLSSSKFIDGVVFLGVHNQEMEYLGTTWRHCCSAEASILEYVSAEGGSPSSIYAHVAKIIENKRYRIMNQGFRPLKNKNDCKRHHRH